MHASAAAWPWQLRGTCDIHRAACLSKLGRDPLADASRCTRDDADGALHAGSGGAVAGNSSGGRASRLRKSSVGVVDCMITAILGYFRPEARSEVVWSSIGVVTQRGGRQQRPAGRPVRNGAGPRGGMRAPAGPPANVRSPRGAERNGTLQRSNKRKEPTRSAQRRQKKRAQRRQKKESLRHPGFPRGPPP